MPNLPINPCLRLVRESIEDFTRQEMDEILAELEARQTRLVGQGMTATQAATQAGKELSETLKIAAKIERRNAAINKRIRLQAVDRIKANWWDKPSEGILAMLFGSPRSRLGSRDSAYAAQSANFRRYIGGLEHDLETAGLFDLVRRREMDQDVTRALWSIDDEDVLGRLPSQAVQVARILDKWREVARKEANRAGAWIGQAKNYITRQTHDPDRMLRKGLAEWKAYILPRLDLDRMFPTVGPIDLNQWLDQAFENLTTGVRPRSPLDATAERMAAFKGPANLAKKQSQERVFHFKDADAWYEYNKEFGSGTLIDTYINDLHRRAEATGLIQTLGTNPEYNLDAIIKAVRTDLSRTDPKKLKKFDDDLRKGRRVENALRELTGYTRTVASSNLALVGSVNRAWNTVTTLGGAVLASITDIPTRASLLRFQGDSYLRGIATGLIAPIKALADAAGFINTTERQAILHGAGHFNDVAMRNVISRFSPDENVSGKIHRATHTFFKWNLLGPWTTVMRGSSIEAFARFVGEQSDQTWDQLTPRTRRSLERYRIDSPTWDLVRKGLVTDESGARFLTPAQIRELPLSNFADYSADRVDLIKKGLLERVKKRMKADEREQGWVVKRHEKFTEALDAANERLLTWAQGKEDRLISKTELLHGRVEKRIGQLEDVAERREAASREKLVEKVLILNKSMGDLRIQLDDLTDWWRFHFDMELAPEYGKRLIRWAGNQEATLKAKQAQTKSQFRRAAAEFRRTMDRITTELEAVKPELARMAEGQEDELRAAARDKTTARYDEFNEHWKERYKELREFMSEMDERLKAREAETTGDLDALGGQVQRTLDNVRNEVADRLQRYYADEVDSAIISPDARANALVRQGTQLGTPMGEVLRAFWQLKTYGIGVVQRGFMREFYGYELGRGGRFGMSEMRGLAIMMVGATAFGYAGLTLKDLARGRKPRSLAYARTWLDAMAQGGSLGMYGDYLLGTQVRFGKGFISSLGGPTVGKLDQLSNMYGAVVSGNDPRAQALRFAINNVPYNNLFYTRAGLDYLFLYEMQEAMNPGYLRRMEQRALEESGQEFWAPPTEAVQ